MDLVQSIRKEGSRGGRGEFKWDDVKTSNHRENYLGHSLMARTYPRTYSGEIGKLRVLITVAAQRWDGGRRIKTSRGMPKLTRMANR